MVEPIYCLKPAWCGRHLAGLRPETGLTVRYGATAFKAVGYHLLCWPVGAMYVYPHNGCLLDAEAECNRGDFAAHALGHLDSDFVHNVGALRPLGYAIHPVAALNEGARSNVQKKPDGSRLSTRHGHS